MLEQFDITNIIACLDFFFYRYMLCFVFGAFKAIKHLLIKSQEIQFRIFCT